MIGISTCWWYNRTDNGEEIVREILQLGLESVELEYRITESIYQQMKPHLQKHLKVNSIHNYFPKPVDLSGKKGSGDLFLLSSTDKDERQRAVQYTIRTIEHAHDIEARAIILHLGRVGIPGVTPTLSERYHGGKRKEKEDIHRMEEQRQERESGQLKNFDAVLRSLDVLNREAERKDIFLGIENRYHFHEIPNFEEIGIILSEFQGGNIGYWHDVGHATAQENVGFTPQADLLDTYGDELLGIHLHDAKGLDDHLPPGSGEVNFEEILSFLKPSHIKVLEIHPKVDRKDLIEGIENIKSLLSREESKSKV
jgi:sugar phosphate isomerase/epimerase